jgi:RNA polymerase sigma-54 factor
MALDHAQQLAQRQATTLIANQIMISVMLRYSAEEFEQAIAQEISENPAFVVEEHVDCVRCGNRLRMGVCPNCDLSSHATKIEDDWWEPSRSPLAEDDHPLNLVPSAETLPARLLLQLRASLPSGYEAIAEYLVGSLDSHGYLNVSVAEVSDALDVDPHQVEETMAVLQSLDPPGVGARDLRECLLLQLRAYEEENTAPHIVRPLIERHLGQLGQRNFAEVARDIGASSAEVKEGLLFIRANFNPYPAHQFEPGDAPGVVLEDRTRLQLLAFPDVIIHRSASGFSAEIVERRRYRFSVEPLYAAMYRRAGARADANYEPSADTHIRHYVRRTQFFLQCVEQRWRTLAQLTVKLIELHSDFLERGVRYLHPLTQSELGKRLGIHESTVSRALAEKYVLLPSGRTISFADFFDDSLAAKDLIKDLVAQEDREHPLSDDDLAHLLGVHGHHLARRTAAKYREALGIPSARSRAVFLVHRQVTFSRRGAGGSASPESRLT